MAQINLSGIFLESCSVLQGYVQCDRVLDLSDYRNIYLQTAKEYVGKISASLGQLSNNILNKEALNNLHIASHSLKSQSQVMGFMNVTALSAAIEKKSRDIIADVTQINDKFISFVRDSVSKLNLELSKIEKRDTETNSA